MSPETNDPSNIWFEFTCPLLIFPESIVPTLNPVLVTTIVVLAATPISLEEFMGSTANPLAPVLIEPALPLNETVFPI